MATRVFDAVAARAPPRRIVGAVAWLRANLFADWGSALATILFALVLARILPGLFDWAVAKAVFAPDNEACRAVGHEGACWGVIAEKYRVILFGRYPYEEQWRPLLATGLLGAVIVASGLRRFWHPWLAIAWIAGLAVFFVLMLGGVAGLSSVETDRWGGFPLTLMLATLGIAAAFPLAIAVALGRRSNLPGIRALCVVYVEIIRGVPLISVLFMASFMFPLFMPPGMTVDVLVRVLVGIILFTAAYLAEVIRGGLQAIPKGQLEAADSLGLTYWQATRKIVLPQALRMVVPAIMNSFIATLKDTSLVTIVSLYELTGALTLALGGDADWRRFYIEGYIFIALIYFACCFSMSRFSQKVEGALDVGTPRRQ